MSKTYYVDAYTEVLLRYEVSAESAEEAREIVENNPHDVYDFPSNAMSDTEVTIIDAVEEL